MPADHPVTGHCLCGRITLRAETMNRDVVYCHCSQCRRQSGHFLAAANVLDAALAVADDDALTWYAASPEAKRGFCRHCGSVLFWKADDSDRTSIFVGCLDAPTGLTATAHIFVADQGDYYGIVDGLPTHETTDG